MKTIVEVGAHTGIETMNFLADGDALVYAFEPDGESFRSLDALAHPRLKVFPFAVDIGDNQEPLFHAPDGKSTLQPPWGFTTSFKMVWTIRLDTFMYLYRIDKIDYLRIDAPFREEMCLESLGARIKDVVKGRIRQYESPSQIPAWLYDHGFSIENDAHENPYLPDVRFWR